MNIFPYTTEQVVHNQILRKDTTEPSGEISNV